MNGMSSKMDKRFTVWTSTHRMIRALVQEEVSAAADTVAKLDSDAGGARESARRFCHTRDQKGHAQEAQGCNGSVLFWPGISGLAGRAASASAPKYEGVRTHGYC